MRVCAAKYAMIYASLLNVAEVSSADPGQWLCGRAARANYFAFQIAIFDARIIEAIDYIDQWVTARHQ